MSTDFVAGSIVGIWIMTIIYVVINLIFMRRSGDKK